MHYRNGREAKNGDRIVKLQDSRIVAFGILYDGKSNNNGSIASIQSPNDDAHLTDCLPIEDMATMIRENGMDTRPEDR